MVECVREKVSFHARLRMELFCCSLLTWEIDFVGRRQFAWLPAIVLLRFELREALSWPYFAVSVSCVQPLRSDVVCRVLRVPNLCLNGGGHSASHDCQIQCHCPIVGG